MYIYCVTVFEKILTILELVNSGQELGPETRASPACALACLCAGRAPLIDG